METNGAKNIYHLAIIDYYNRTKKLWKRKALIGQENTLGNTNFKIPTNFSLQIRVIVPRSIPGIPKFIRSFLSSFSSTVERVIYIPTRSRGGGGRVATGLTRVNGVRIFGRVQIESFHLSSRKMISLHVTIYRSHAVQNFLFSIALFFPTTPFFVIFWPEFWNFNSNFHGIIE